VLRKIRLEFYLWIVERKKKCVIESIARAIKKTRNWRSPSQGKFGSKQRVAAFATRHSKPSSATCATLSLDL
jgi:hypothetical protein